MQVEFEPAKEIILIMVSAIVEDDESKILLLKRSKTNKTFRGFWQLPEGKVEKDESPEEALKRELSEELKVKIKAANFIGSSTNRFEAKENKYFTVRLVSKVEITDEIVLDEDHDKYEWFAIDNLPQKLLPGVKEAIGLL